MIDMEKAHKKLGLIISYRHFCISLHHTNFDLFVSYCYKGNLDVSLIKLYLILETKSLLRNDLAVNDSNL